MMHVATEYSPLVHGIKRIEGPCTLVHRNRLSHVPGT